MKMYKIFSFTFFLDIVIIFKNCDHLYFSSIIKAEKQYLIIILGLNLIIKYKNSKIKYKIIRQPIILFKWFFFL